MEYTVSMVFVADTSYLLNSPYGIWGIILVIFLLGMVCFNAWHNDADERRKGYYVLGSAFVLGLLILLGLHIWEVNPADIFQRHRYHNFRHSRFYYNYFIILTAGWLAASWYAGRFIDQLLHPEEDTEADE